jgi:hypothetical protein
VRGGGGEFGEELDSDELLLPTALAIPELEANPLLPRSGLPLSWTGAQGEQAAPLAIVLDVVDSSGTPLLRLECRAIDDGEFEIPAEVLEVVPDGRVHATFTRENQSSARAGDKSVIMAASVALELDLELVP